MQAGRRTTYSDRGRVHLATAAADPTRPGVLHSVLSPYAVLFRSRDIGVLFAGQAVSEFGDWLYITALGVFAYALTQSAVVVAALTFVRLLPYALLLPVGGVLADRFEPRRLMILSDLGRFACMLGLLAVTSRDTLWIAFPLVFVSTCLFSLFRPAFGALLPLLIPDEQGLGQANTVRGQIYGLGFVIGPSATGVLVLLGHTRYAFALNAASYALSALTLVRVHTPSPLREARAEAAGWLAETAAGYRFLFRENDGVLAAVTAVTAAAGLLAGAYWTLVVVMSTSAFRLGEQGVGFLNSAYGAGGLLGGLLVGAVVGRVKMSTGFIAVTALNGVACLLWGIVPGGALAFLLPAVAGASDVIGEIFSSTLLQVATPHAMMGRVLGAFMSTTIAAMVIGAVAAGPLIAELGPRTTTVALSLLSLIALLVGLPWLRRTERVLGVRAFLRRVPVLTMVPLSLVDELASLVRSEQAVDGAVIVRQGEVGDTLYLIKQGAVDVVARAADGREVHLETLGDMDFFGEIALLRDVPRTATVRARGEVVLYSLERAAFQSLVARSDDLRAALENTSEARYTRVQAVLTPRL